MTRRKKILLGTAIALTVLVIGSMVAVATAVYSAGMIEVEVQEHDGQVISIRVPAAFVQVASGVAFRFMPDEVFAECGEELAEYWPVIEEFCKGIARCPDTEFVNVEGRHERVSVAKADGKLVVHVEDGRDRVYISIPIGMVEVVTKQLYRNTPQRNFKWSKHKRSTLV